MTLTAELLMCLFMAMTMSWTPPALTTASFTSSFPAMARIALRTCRTSSCRKTNTSAKKKQTWTRSSSLSCTLPLTHSCLRAKSSWVLIHPYHRCLDRTHSVQPDEIKSHTAHSKQKCCQGDLHGRYPRNQNYLSVPANTKRLESAEAKSILIWSAGLTFGSLNQHLQSAVFKNNTLSVFMSVPKRNPHVIIKGHDSESCAGLLNHLHTFTVLCDGNSEQRQDATFNKILPVLFVL